MNCRYCGSVNAASDHRCNRCGRRLHFNGAHPGPEVYPVEGGRALAPAPRAETAAAPQDDEIPQPDARRRAPYQPALFTTRELGRVVPIEAYQARAAERRERAQRAEGGGRSANSATEGTPAQEAFPFQQPPAPRARPAAGEIRYSKAPVAIPVHRMMAAALDLSIVLISSGAVSLIFHFLAPDHSPMPGSPLYWFAALAAALGLLFKGAWALAEIDSPGLRWCHLKLLNFDGLEPSRAQRFRRILWSVLSVMAGGLGLVWALVDEETLSWHDHSSKTFLTSFSQPAGRS